MEFRAETTSRVDMADSSAKTRWRLLTEALPMLHRYARRLVGERERANEILQEVSLRMLATDGPADPQRYRAWGRGIVRHVLAQDWRMRQRALAEQPIDDGFAEQVAGSTQDLEGHLDARTSIARLAGDLDR